MWLSSPNKRTELPDATVIARYRASGDTQYLGVLFDRYAHLVFGVCMKYLKNEEDSKDALMHVFEGLGADLRRFEVRNFPPWIHSVAKNHCLMQLRKRRLLVNDEYGFAQAEATLLTFPSDMRFLNEDVTDRHLDNLDLAMASLSPEQQQCIRLFYLEELSYQQVSKKTGYDLKQVKSYIQNGKRNLKNYLIKKAAHEKE